MSEQVTINVYPVGVVSDWQQARRTAALVVAVVRARRGALSGFSEDNQ